MEHVFFKTGTFLWSWLNGYQLNIHVAWLWSIYLMLLWLFLISKGFPIWVSKSVLEGIRMAIFILISQMKRLSLRWVKQFHSVLPTYSLRLVHECEDEVNLFIKLLSRDFMVFLDYGSIIPSIQSLGLYVLWDLEYFTYTYT